MRRRWLVVPALVAVLMLGGSGAASAAASDHGSCTGVQSSNATAYFGPGAVADFNHQFQAIAQQEGVPFGSLVSAISQQHLGYSGCFD